jgi:hypothetical protein
MATKKIIDVNEYRWKKHYEVCLNFRWQLELEFRQEQARVRFACNLSMADS